MLAIVRPPSPQLADGLVTHIDRLPVDVGAARRQWQAYVDVLAGNGWQVIEAPSADSCPDGVFVEDTAVVFGDLAVCTRPGAPSRRAEVDTIEPLLAAAGLHVHRIIAPGTLDGGDVLKVGRTAYVGRGARTNDDGIHQLRRLLAPAGWEVVAVPLSKVLHLKSAVAALPDGTIVGWPPALNDVSVFPSFLAVPEEAGAHVVDLGSRRLLIDANAVASQQVLRGRGYVPVPVDIGEFVKLEGCVTCLSVRIRS
jgi:dimethylargininase